MLPRQRSASRVPTSTGVGDGTACLLSKFSFELKMYKTPFEEEHNGIGTGRLPHLDTHVLSSAQRASVVCSSGTCIIRVFGLPGWSASTVSFPGRPSHSRIFFLSSLPAPSYSAKRMWQLKSELLEPEACPADPVFIPRTLEAEKAGQVRTARE